MNKKFPLGSEEFLRDALITFDKVLAVLWKANDKLPNIKNDLLMTLWTMAWPIVESGMSLIDLAQKQRMRDCYILARPIFEHVLNMGYFGAKGTTSIEKALKHVHQKSYRDLKREISIKDFQFAISLCDIERIPISTELRNALDEFTSQKGFEIRSWTGDNTYKKIEVISEKYGSTVGSILTISLFYIYRHSSEIIHGTLFGSLFSRGLTKLSCEWPENSEQLRVFQNSHLSFIVQNAILMAYCAMSIIDYHFPMKKDLEQIKKIVIDYRTQID